MGLRYEEGEIVLYWSVCPRNTRTLPGGTGGNAFTASCNAASEVMTSIIHTSARHSNARITKTSCHAERGFCFAPSNAKPQSKHPYPSKTGAPVLSFRPSRVLSFRPTGGICFPFCHSDRREESAFLTACRL